MGKELILTQHGTPNHSDFTAAHFRADKWLARWTEARGGFVSGYCTPHLVRPPCNCATLESLSQQIANPDFREAVAIYLRLAK
jgi:hypothetical protein